MRSETPPESACGNVRLQRFILRLMTSLSLIALPAVIVPRMAVEKLSWLMGFGQPPMVPLLVYMTAGGSCVYIGQAVLLWFISLDVVRYRPLVLLLGWAYLAFGPVFIWIHLDAGTPHWWMAMDSLSCLAAGAALLWACRSR